MKLEDAKKRYGDLSKQASDNTRTLALAGIAVVWVFKEGIGDATRIPVGLLWPLFWFLLALSLDYLHYFLGATGWFIYFRCREKLVGEGGQSDDNKHDAMWPNVLWVLFWAKGVALIAGYWVLSNVILARLFAPLPG